MALVFFRSKAAAEIIMLGDTARRLLESMGRCDAQGQAPERGVLRGPAVAEAIAALEAAVALEDAREGPRDPFADEGVPAHRRPVRLAQRAFPLLAMLRAAQARGADVTWEP